MYVGLVQLGDNCLGVLRVADTSDTPVDADALPTFRVYGPDGFVAGGTCSLLDSGVVAGASNASPVVITDATHGLTTGARIVVSGVGGNGAANGTFVVTRIDADTFSLDGSAGNGSWTSGGVWHAAGAYRWSVACTGGAGFAAGENYAALFDYEVADVARGQEQSFTVV